MTEGIIARFRTMAIFRPSVLTGHVLGSLIKTMITLAAVLGVALFVGFRPTANLVEWVAAIGVLVMVAVALVWLCVALGLVSKSVESASNTPMPLMLLPFLGSGFVPTDSMPAPVRWFADHQPFTPIMETLRGLLLGTAIGSNAVEAVAWCGNHPGLLPLGKGALQPRPHTLIRIQRRASRRRKVGQGECERGDQRQHAQTHPPIGHEQP